MDNKIITPLHDDHTVIIPMNDREKVDVKEVLRAVLGALKEKGYDPVNQLVSFIMCGDPTYITAHNNARSMIMKVEREELLEELVNYYISKEEEK